MTHSNRDTDNTIAQTLYLFHLLFMSINHRDTCLLATSLIARVKRGALQVSCSHNMKEIRIKGKEGLR